MRRPAMLVGFLLLPLRADPDSFEHLHWGRYLPFATGSNRQRAVVRHPRLPLIGL